MQAVNSEWFPGFITTIWKEQITSDSHVGGGVRYGNLLYEAVYE